ncbi:MAG: tRNA preQ1(34) S-adenosylmethionine ribosyltransferase-isomerase QueA [Bacteroidales bacterium]|nr:tRNA preQ1(34) S-adenosylmethionine ribosyltransferase-isomerase QueA [Bacteroidales bacterium]
MKLSQFIYELPQDHIAQYPAKNRDDSRLMVLHKDSGKIEHKIFKDVINYFDADDIFVFNNTRVFPARLKGIKEKTGAKIEVFLLRELNRKQRLWDVLVSPARKIRIGNKLYFGDSETLVAEVIDNTTSRGRTLRFLFDGEYEEFKKTLTELGETPLPGFIGRPTEPEDSERYQTVFAEQEGAVAAPTAGMHFSKILLKKFEIKGIKTTAITLHVGLGNFRNINVEDLSKHKMDNEQININDDVADIINDTKSKKQRVCAVGTSVIRTLESATTVTGLLKSYEGWTNKFIFPPYEFSIPSAMITNFHMPKSIPLMSAAAFGGFKKTMKAYNEALKKGYKFGSYGDAMLII